MGVVKSIFEPIAEETAPSVDVFLIDRLLDDIVLEYAGLIADIEEKKVSSDFLMKEIEKRVDRQKGLYDPEGVKRKIFNTIYGYGILQEYVMDETVSDIDATRYDYILIKRQGKIEIAPVAFASEETFERYCRLLIIRHGGIINTVDTHSRVSDKVHHLRINVSIPPRNTSGAALNIRKHKPTAYTYETLIQLKFLNSDVQHRLEYYNQQKRNILICGKGGSGKTTLLRTLIDTVDAYERLLICETDSEIYPQRQNVIVQKIHKHRQSGHEVKLEALIREGLTMSLDTYCIGEIVGEEAWDYIKAGYTDHRTLATLHANSAKDAVHRLMLLVEGRTRLEQSTLKEIIIGSLDVIVYLRDFSVIEIAEVVGYDRKNDQVLLSYDSPNLKERAT